MKNPKVLIIEDDPDGRRSVSDAIVDAGYDVVAVSTGEEGVQRFSEERFDSVLCDLILPGMDGVAALREVRKMDDRVPVLIMTAYGSVSTAVDALKEGAYDYLTKPLDLEDLQSKTQRAVEVGRLRAEVSRLRDRVSGNCNLEHMVAESAGMKLVIEEILTLADTTATVLIQGESGTGKELVARALHFDSMRADGPFVAVNCGALTESLLESELFGHEKGAFTGATETRKGAFERSDGGTIFLDEIGNAPESVQIKLLRILEDREVVRVGGQRSIRVDVRVVSAANKDLEDLVSLDDFREDLLYRLKVVTIYLPPLRDRLEDIRPLALRFIAMACNDHGRKITEVGEDCYDILESYQWPGNVRELKNVIESSVVMARGTGLRGEDIRIRERNRLQGTELSVPPGMTMEDVEKQLLLQVLDRLQGNRTLAAEELGLSRRTVQRKIQEYDLPF